jgi:hypothetical protein
MSLTEIASLVSALTAFGAMMLSWRNSFKIKEVDKKVEATKPRSTT